MYARTNATEAGVIEKTEESLSDEENSSGILLDFKVTMWNLNNV